MSNDKRKLELERRAMQQAFLVSLRSGEMTVAQAMEAAKVKRAQLAKWLGSPRFAARLAKLKRRLAAMRSLEAIAMGIVASVRVSTLLTDTADAVRDKTAQMVFRAKSERCGTRS